MSRLDELNLPADEERAVIIAAWLARYDDTYDTYGKKLEDRPTIFDAFESALSDLSPEVLNWAFAQWMKHGKSFPNPGQIRELVVKQETQRDDLAAEQAWELVHWMMRKFCWTSEMGLQPIFTSAGAKLTPKMEEHSVRDEFGGALILKPKPFDDRTEYAIRSAGGLSRIAQTEGTKDFDFCKRNFIQAHKYFVVTSGLTLPSREESKQLIGNLQKQLENAK